MGYRFEWDAAKAAGNLKKHGVTFDEAITAFGDPLNVLLPDPDHGGGERRYLRNRSRNGVLPLIRDGIVLGRGNVPASVESDRRFRSISYATCSFVSSSFLLTKTSSAARS
jgi:hypothetical protein